MTWTLAHIYYTRPKLMSKVTRSYYLTLQNFFSLCTSITTIEILTMVVLFPFSSPSDRISFKVLFVLIILVKAGNLLQQHVFLQERYRMLHHISQLERDQSQKMKETQQQARHKKKNIELGKKSTQNVIGNTKNSALF